MRRVRGHSNDGLELASWNPPQAGFIELPLITPAVLRDVETWKSDCSEKSFRGRTSLLPLGRSGNSLRYVAGLPEGEIATALKISRGTVSSTLHDARQRLGRLLNDDNESKETTDD
jgi:hypothetical protein